MSAVKAQELVARMANDAEFRTAVLELPTREEKRAYLESAGFGGVTPEQVKDAGPSVMSEISDAELEAVAGGRVVEWVGAVSATVAGAAAVVGAAAAAL